MAAALPWERTGIGGLAMVWAVRGRAFADEAKLLADGREVGIVVVLFLVVVIVVIGGGEDGSVAVIRSVLSL